MLEAQCACVARESGVETWATRHNFCRAFYGKRPIGATFFGRLQERYELERAVRKRTRTIEFTIETERRVERHRAAAPKITGTCAVCAAESLMVTPDEAARVAGVSARTIYRWIEAGKVHFADTPEGSLLVCLNSFS